METSNPHPASTIALILLLFTIINQSLSARTLTNPSPPHHQAHLAIAFYMPDILTKNHPLSKPVTRKVNGHQLPFSKPLGLFPPSGGIPINLPDPSFPNSQTLDLQGIGMSFPAIATLQELELGTVTTINEPIYPDSIFGSSSLGKAQGVYVASSEDGTSHMMAMTVSLVNNAFNDGLQFFGVHRTDFHESHIAVIGGMGKYHNANGYATVERVNTTKGRDSEEEYKLLLFNVYLG